MKGSYEILIQKLNTFIREYYKNLIARGFIYSLTGLVSVLIVFAVIEHFNFFSESIRSLLFWSYCAIGIIVIIKFIILPTIKMLRLTGSLSHEEAAKIIGRYFEEVADKLTNILELNDINAGNEALIHASIDQKIKEIEFTPFNNAIDWSLTLHYAKYMSIPILLILCFFVSGNKEIISDSTFRIINYNRPFTAPAPFYFELLNDSLVAIENSDFSIIVQISGDELPREVFVNYNNRFEKMNPLSKTTYSYTFENVRKNIDFYLSANNEYSTNYQLFILGRPQIEKMDMYILPPKHTNIKGRSYINTGSMSVPEGSQIVWKIKTKKTDSLKFAINETYPKLGKKVMDNYFEIKQTIDKNSQYYISLANHSVSFIDTTFYDIKIVRDAFPSISINKKSDANNTFSMISGVIRDDYGLFDLTSFSRIYGLDRDTTFNTKINIDENLRSQSFLSTIIDPSLSIKPGESIDCYFIVRDNDAKNGYKSTQSSIITIRTDTYEEIQTAYDENTEIIKNDITTEMSILKNLELELLDFEKDLIEKDSLDWKDKKRLEDILEKQSDFDEKIEELKNSSQENFNKLNSSSPPSEEMLKKQQELQELFDKIIPEEMKELYQELSDLKDKLDKNELQQKLKDLQLSNEDLEKELDRNLEILKQIEFEQKLETIISRLETLQKSQIMLSKNSEQTILEKIKLQKTDAVEFTKIQSEIEQIHQLNNQLENKQRIPETKTLEDQISEHLQTGISDLEKGNKKRAIKSQKKASEDLGSLANFFTNMKKENEKDQQYEDMDVLRQILENLVYFSIEEESILLEFQTLDKNDPQYIDLMHTQQALRDASKIIEDSLFALSKRVPQISSKINREINAIDKKASSAIDHLRERLTMKAVQDQQFIMTSANNLAVLLSQILRDMQEEMANNMPSSQQCEKPGKGSPKPGDLKKMQEQLNKHLQDLQKQIEKGEQNNMQNEGMSKKLVEMLAKQELIRQSLEEFKDKMSNKEELRSLQEAVEDMKKTEEDIVNKKITMESLSRQKNILTRLLEIENALREQGEDEKRESKTATSEYERIIQNAYEKYELEKLKETEMLKTTPPSFSPYYKEKVNRYFNLIIK